MLDTPCPETVWTVLATHSIRQFPLHFSSRTSPCAITFQLESTTNVMKTPNSAYTICFYGSVKFWGVGWFGCVPSAVLERNLGVGSVKGAKRTPGVLYDSSPVQQHYRAWIGKSAIPQYTIQLKTKMKTIILRYSHSEIKLSLTNQVLFVGYKLSIV